MTHPEVMTWINVARSTIESDKFQVRYYCKGGFSLETTVDEKTAELIKQAIEYGKQLRSREILRLLGGRGWRE